MPSLLFLIIQGPLQVLHVPPASVSYLEHCPLLLVVVVSISLLGFGCYHPMLPTTKGQVY